MIVPTTNVNAKNAYRKLRRIERLLLRRSGDVSSNIGKAGSKHAKVIAPFQTGKTARLIRTITRRTNNGAYTQVIAPNPTRGGSHRLFNQGSYNNFDLVKWMHATKGIFRSNNPLGRKGERHITSGDPQFMYTTRRYLQRIGGSVAQNQISKINLR